MMKKTFLIKIFTIIIGATLLAHVTWYILFEHHMFPKKVILFATVPTPHSVSKHAKSDPANGHTPMELRSTAGCVPEISYRIYSLRNFPLNDTLSSRSSDQAPNYTFLIPVNATDEEMKRFHNATTSICELINFLENHPRLNAVAGKSDLVPEPYCTAYIKSWTVYYSYDWTNIAGTGGYVLHDATLGVCYGCVLLPDTFLVRTDALRTILKKSKFTYAKYGESFLLPLLLELTGTAVYCQDFDMDDKQLSSVTNRYCDGLQSRWDHKFMMVYMIIHAYRIVLPTGTEAWLNCAFKASLSKLSLQGACANWLFRMTIDGVQTVKALGADYRLVYGSALGAVRGGDIMPWTSDVDIAMPISQKNFSNFKKRFKKNVKKLSRNRYYYLRYDDTEHFRWDPIRMFPCCPIILEELRITTDREMKQIVKEFKTAKTLTARKRHHFHPAIDIFSPGWMPKMRKQDAKDIFNKPDYASIRGHSFQVISPILDHLRHNYGNGSKWNVEPSIANNFNGVFYGNQ